MDEIPSSLASRVARLLGAAVVSARVARGGYSPALRFVVTLGDGRRAFIKSGADSPAAALATWLRLEERIYRGLGSPLLPRLLGWDDDGESPLLILDDLSAATWPPPWDAASIGAVRDALAELATLPAPSGVPPLEALREELRGWTLVAEDPEPFLRLGLASRAWLDRHLATLVDAERAADLSGSAVVHGDVRSDNLCLVDGRVRLFDWNWAHQGSPFFDLASWLPSLAHEGGPRPWEVMPDSHGLAALIGGFFAARAGLPILPHAPRVRELQRAQAVAAWPWVCRELGLPLPGG